MTQLCFRNSHFFGATTNSTTKAATGDFLAPTTSGEFELRGVREAPSVLVF